MDRAALFTAIRALSPTGKLSSAVVPHIDAIADDWGLGVGAAGALSPSPAAYAIIQEFEGYAKDLGDGRVQAYPDPGSGGDPWTIGWGSTGPDIKRGTVWTRAMAESRFQKHVAEFSAKVAEALDGAVTTQPQFDAMVSLAYNVGMTNFGGSTLLRLHKAGDFAGARGQFVRWNKAAGRIMAGLARRREAEAALYGKTA